MNIKRSSLKELNNKILQAKNAVTKGSLFLLDPVVIAADALNLGYLINEVNEVLIEILNELKLDYYVGGRPPQRSYESKNKIVSRFYITRRCRSKDERLTFLSLQPR